MIKCPHCGARILGKDLLSGECASCHKRLTASVEFEDDPRATIATSPVVGPPSPSAAPSGSEALSSETSAYEPGEHPLAPVPVAPGTRAGSSISDSLGDSSEADGQATANTFVSYAPPLSSEVMDAPSVADEADDDANKTYVSEDLPVEEDQSTLKTFQMDVADDAQRTLDIADATAADKTIVSESFDDLGLGDNQKTIVSEEFESGPVADDRTFVSDDVPEAVIKTLQSEWGGTPDNTRPEATLKAREKQHVKQAKQTLVIKTRSLRDVKVETTADGSEPEYELLKVLGEGGMGVVYDARQTSIDRNVALKMIKGAAAQNDKQKAKFLAEAVVTGDLDHPNIVPIYDVGRNSLGALFYSMKKVQGTPWADVIREKSLDENLDILMRVADAVGFAHARGVVHRDLKPENTMLGEFGEVLVMDWGLAQPAKHFRKAASITETQSMGGTPAYMAPEMATGPLDKISPQSDIYLLGAMLYEILTGHPPHAGKTAMKCLMSAARNEIVPTEKTGELIDVALKAMATEPVDRYVDVRAFQSAIREYQSHSESILLSVRAEEDLGEAKKSDDYQEYAKALFGFREAFELWSGNKRALTGISQAQRAYADSARRKGDLDLGLSLLNELDADHQPLRQQLLADRQEREARQGRIAALKRMGYAMATVMFVIVTGAYFWISHEADKARKAEAVAVKEKQEADLARDAATSARDAATKARDQEVIAKQEAVAAKEVAVQRQVEAEQARAQEVVAKQQAVAAREIAEEKRQEAEVARAQEELAKRAEEYEAYIARIGLAAAKINENAFETATQLLDGCKPELRNWEWGRLMHLCRQSRKRYDAHAPLDALAISPDGIRFATGGWDGAARIWNRETGKELFVLKHGGLYVHAVAFSPDGRLLATGGDDPDGYVQLWNVETGQRLKTFAGHDDGVLSVMFSKDGARLLTSSYDKTARLWNVADARELKTFRGHTWWVWQAVFSPDETQIATVSQDGSAFVWSVDSDRRPPPFTGHRGPVYCVDFLPDGQTLVTGGFDRRILLWKAGDIQPFNFKNLERGGRAAPPAQFRELAGHATGVRSLHVMASGGMLLSASEDNTVRLWDVAGEAVVKTFRGHSSGVRAAVVAPDGRRLLSASHDASVLEWSIADYEELRAIQGRKLEGHADAVLAASFSPNQALIVTASRDRTARTWDSRTGALQQTFEEGHQFLASTALFYDNGRRLLTAAVDNTARVWDVATGTQLMRFDRAGRAASAAVLHDGQKLITGGNDKQAQLWDLQTGKVLKEFPGHHAEVTAVAVSADDRWLLTGDAKGFAAVWDLTSGKRTFELKGHSRRIAAAAFVPEAQRALTASGDNTVAQWDLSTGREVASGILKHPDSVLALALVPGTERVVTSAADKLVRVWDLRTAKVVSTIGPFDELIHTLDVSADGARLLTAQAETRVVRLWELSTSRELQTPAADGSLGPLVDLKKYGGLLWAAAFAPGDDVLTVGGSDARLWDLKTGRERMSFSPHGAVASANFSPDNTLLVTGSWDNSAKIWDARTGKSIKKLEGGHTAFVNTAVFSPDGQFVLTASDDGTAKRWSLATAAVIRSFDGHGDRVRYAAFSKDGSHVITAGNDKTARLWNAQTGVEIRTFAGHQWAVLTADFSKDGSRLITGSEDNTAKVWNVDTGECLFTLSGHTAPVASVAFAPDGARVLTGSHDQAAKLWDAKTGKEILTLSRHTEDVTSVSFSPDGKQVLTGSRDGTALLWPATEWKPAAAPVAQR